MQSVVRLSMNMVDEVKAALQSVARAEKAEFFPSFFKSGKGEYAEGDKFIGVTVPDQRKIAKKFKDLSLEDISILLKSDIHEHRLTALFILVGLMAKAKGDAEEIFATFYLDHKEYVNNWDLVDSSAPHILGKYLFTKDTNILYDLAKSESLWDRRIAMISTQYFNRKEKFDDTLKIAAILLHDEHDLIHKAVGWMLREVGDHEPILEEAFLMKHYKTMPRTMLRYAIEKFPEGKRKRYLAGIV
jgi:3-methyladenine DNA glycosylase AlkD